MRTLLHACVCCFPALLVTSHSLLLLLLLLLLLPPPSLSTMTSSTNTTIGGDNITSHSTTTPSPPTWRTDITPTTSPLTPTKSDQCRDRFGFFPVPVFRLWTCGHCFQYVYNNPAFASFRRFYIVINDSRSPAESVLPDPDRPLEVGKVCRAVERAGLDCRRWLDCCQAAHDCCQRQLSLQAGSRGGPEERSEVSTGEASSGEDSSSRNPGSCPATWDGFSCWDDSPAGRSVSVPCPTYTTQGSTEGLGHKTCEANGTWYVNPQSGLEWTDYTRCVTIQPYWVVFWVAVVCDGISLLLLLPASFTFLFFRSLRNQPRIRLHTCLFVTSVIFHTTMLLRELVVVPDRLTTAQNDRTVLNRNSVWCRLLHVLTRYGWSTLNAWMLLESVYLYSLMARAFAASKSLLPYYLTGYGPWIFFIPYVIIRTSMDHFNTKCWAYNAGHYEWIISIPILLCLVGSMAFLGKTLHVMMTQLQSHPNEPSNFRRGVKALLMLVPLFGLQSLLVMIRPSAYSLAYEVVSTIVIGTQGAIIAIVFCYLNGEVLALYRNALKRVSLTNRADRTCNSQLPRFSVSTQMTTEVSSRSLVSYTHPTPPHPLTQPSTAERREGQDEGGEEGGEEEEESRVPLSPLGQDSQCADTDIDSCKPGLQNGLV